MAAERIKVNTDRLSNDADQVNQSITRMKSKMEEMQESVSAMDQMWDGESSEAFKSAFASDMTMLSTMISNLSKIYNFEKNASKKYNSCEQKVLEMVNAIKV